MGVFRQHTLICVVMGKGQEHDCGLSLIPETPAVAERVFCCFSFTSSVIVNSSWVWLFGLGLYTDISLLSFV